MPKRVDLNQPSIVQALRAAGATVTCTHELGHGYPDLSVGFRGISYLLEVKLPKAALTPDERAWHDDWRGSVAIVHDAQEALAAIGAI
jgi:hypothetical protein